MGSPVIGVALPANVEAGAKRLVTEIKAFDTFVDSVRAKVPANAYTAWKLWAKGTVDALVAVLTKSATQAAVLTFPLWPAGALFAGGAVAVDKATDDSFIAGEYAKLNVWRETFRAAGAPPPGPDPTPPPGMTPPGTSNIVDVISKGALTLGAVGIGVLVLSKVLGR